MAGIVGSALGQALANVGTTVGNLMVKRADEDERRAWQERVMQLEEEKQLRLDAIRRQRDTDDIGKRAEATAQANLKVAPTNAQAAVVGETARLEAEATAGLPAKRAESAVAGEVAKADAIAGSGLIAKQAGNKLTEWNAGKPLREAGRQEAIDGEVDTQTQLAKNPDYLKARGTLATAAEGSGTKAAAATAQFELAQKKLLADLRTNLSKTEDPAARKALENQIRDLSGASTKSYSDMVSAGNAFRLMAGSLREQLRNNPPVSEAETADIEARIKSYETEAASILGATVDKRLGPETRGAETGGGRKVGDTQVVQSGPNKGKTARWDGKGWVLAN